MGSFSKNVQNLGNVVVRFAGDSGDGMQLLGSQFSQAVAFSGNDISTVPSYPGEIRATAGTLAGVSGFQVNFSNEPIYTPGDKLDLLAAMNPAALRVNLKDLVHGGLLIVNSGTFIKSNLKKAGYTENPLEDGSLCGVRLIPVDMNHLVKEAVLDLELTQKEIARCNNFFALGLMYWLYNCPTEVQKEWIMEKFSKNPKIADANIKVFMAGYFYGENTEILQETYKVPPSSSFPSGTYRSITGNSSLALGLLVAARKSNLNLFLGSYPITPASEILHELSGCANHGVTTFQAEDEIAAMCSAIGASYGGALSVVTTSGPGISLKAEAMGLAVMMELPVVIVNVQRAGPSTGMPTKTEQSDLLQALYGRNGDSPIPVLAARTASDCFDAAIKASRIAIKYMTPVILLSDAYIANSSEPWKIPDIELIDSINVKFRTETDGYAIYGRDTKTNAREWVIPGTVGLEHRIGGLEKDGATGEVSYDANNHQHMTNERHKKVNNIANDIPLIKTAYERNSGLLVVGFGGTYGSIKQAVINLNKDGKKVDHLHLDWINPLPKNTGEILSRYEKVLICEQNNGQLSKVLRDKFLVPSISYSRTCGRPFIVSEITEVIGKILNQ